MAINCTCNSYSVVKEHMSRPVICNTSLTLSTEFTVYVKISVDEQYKKLDLISVQANLFKCWAL